MKPSRLSRLPGLVRSIFLPRQSAAVPAGLEPVNRIASMDRSNDSLADGSVDVVLEQAVDLTGQTTRLRSPDAEIARDAAAELGRIGDRAALQPLLDVLINAEGFFHPLVRAAAASSLGQIKDCRATDSLIAATADPIAEVSEQATIALGLIGEVHSVEPLMAIVANKNGFFLHPVRRAAITSLGQFRDARVASLILTVSMNEAEDPSVREAARRIKIND